MRKSCTGSILSFYRLVLLLITWSWYPSGFAQLNCTAFILVFEGDIRSDIEWPPVMIEYVRFVISIAAVEAPDCPLKKMLKTLCIQYKRSKWRDRANYSQFFGSALTSIRSIKLAVDWQKQFFYSPCDVHLECNCGKLISTDMCDLE